MLSNVIVKLIETNPVALLVSGLIAMWMVLKFIRYVFDVLFLSRGDSESEEVESGEEALDEIINSIDQADLMIDDKARLISEAIAAWRMRGPNFTSVVNEVVNDVEQPLSPSPSPKQSNDARARLNAVGNT